MLLNYVNITSTLQDAMLEFTGYEVICSLVHWALLIHKQPISCICTYCTVVNLSTFVLSVILEVEMTAARNQSLELVGKHLKSPCDQPEVLYK